MASKAAELAPSTHCIHEHAVVEFLIRKQKRLLEGDRHDGIRSEAGRASKLKAMKL